MQSLLYSNSVWLWYSVLGNIAKAAKTPLGILCPTQSRKWEQVILPPTFNPLQYLCSISKASGGKGFRFEMYS